MTQPQIREPDTRWSPRVTAYLCLGSVLTLSYFALRGVVWIGSVQIHSLMETVATMLAAIVGVMAIVRYYTEKNNTILIIGAGFLGTAFLDAYHAIVTAEFFAYLMPSDLPSLSPWSWIASRQFLALMLCLSWLAWMREQRLGSAGAIESQTVFVSTAMLTIISFLFFALVPLPLAYFPGTIFHRPEEYIPALFFAVALFGYLRKGQWRYDAFEHWLVLALIVSLVTQVSFMPFSAQLFDFEFDIAHLLKQVSYIFVLIGLLIGMYDTFREVDFVANRLETVLSNTIDGIITIDERGTVQTFNVAAENIFGYRAAEVIGHNVKVLMPTPYREEHDDYLSNFHNTGHKKIIGIGREVVGLRKDGSVFPMDLGVTEASLANAKIFIGSVRDITELKQAELQIVERTHQLEAANAELDAFAYSISHDLRAPLRAMGGFAEALTEDYGNRLDGNALDYLQRIGKASQRMGRMIDDILNLSRTMRLDMNMAPVNLSAISEEILSQHREAEPDRNVTVVVAPDIVVRGDARLLEMVLRNLIHNAWKFSGNEPQSHIEFNTLQMDNQRVFFVRDNGAGFDMAYVDKLFGIFQRLHPKMEFEGSGIGLATVARLIGRHGGRVWGESVDFEGATFYFTVDNITEG